MGTRRALAAVTATTVVLALAASSCARAAETSEVSTDAPEKVSLQTSTTVARSASGAGSPSTRSTKAGSGDLAQTAAQLFARLAADPSLLAQLTGMDISQIAALTGMDPAALASLNISPDAIRALAGALGGIDPTLVRRLGAGANLDPKLATTILMLAAQVDPAAALAIKGVDPLAIASLISAATTVDPKVVASIGSVLKVADPNGLGRLADDKSSLALLAVMFGVAMRTDPSKFAQLGNAANLDPNVNFVLNSISGLAAGLTPQVVSSLNGLSKVLGPDLLKALSAMMGILGRPDVAPVVQAAAKDPVVLVSTLGTFALLIPGLAEVLAPDVFANNPNARYGLLAGLIGVAIANLNGLDLNALAGTLGLPPLNPDFGR